MYDAISGSRQCDASDEEDGEHGVREDRREVYHLQPMGGRYTAIILFDSQSETGIDYVVSYASVYSQSHSRIVNALFYSLRF